MHEPACYRTVLQWNNLPNPPFWRTTNEGRAIIKWVKSVGILIGHDILFLLKIQFTNFILSFLRRRNGRWSKLLNEEVELAPSFHPPSGLSKGSGIDAPRATALNLWNQTHGPLPFPIVVAFPNQHTATRGLIRRPIPPASALPELKSGSQFSIYCASITPTFKIAELFLFKRNCFSEMLRKEWLLQVHSHSAHKGQVSHSFPLLWAKTREMHSSAERESKTSKQN
jgi:hypothetical protein